MQTGGWKTKNWSDFTCYTSDGSLALTMELISDEITRWSIYGSGPDRGWTLILHNMEHGVFCARHDDRLLEGDIEKMELRGDTLHCSGKLRIGGRVIADCEAEIRLSETDGAEVFIITYRYQFAEEGPYEVLQQYGAPLSGKQTPILFLPTEGFSLSWDRDSSSLRATVFVDQPVLKKAEFQVGFRVDAQ